MPDVFLPSMPPISYDNFFVAELKSLPGGQAQRVKRNNSSPAELKSLLNLQQAPEKEHKAEFPEL